MDPFGNGTCEGKALNATLSEFWAQHTASMDESWVVCPNAMTAWKPGEDEIWKRRALRASTNTP